VEGGSTKKKRWRDGGFVWREGRIVGGVREGAFRSKKQGKKGEVQNGFIRGSRIKVNSKRFGRYNKTF